MSASTTCSSTPAILRGPPHHWGPGVREPARRRPPAQSGHRSDPKPTAFATSREMPMSEASEASPIKVGFLMDYISESRTMDDLSNYSEPLDLVFREGTSPADRPAGRDRYRSAQGLPRGNTKAVIDAFGELVDEGCVAVIGPHISDNAVTVRPEIERRFRVPAISVCGSEHWLGEWTFLLNNGSMTDEPILWAHLMAKSGQDGRGARRALVHRPGVPRELPPRRAVRGHPDRRRRSHRADRSGHLGRGRRAPRGGRERDRALRLRPGCRGDQRRARRRSTGIRRATWAPRSRPASTSTSGTRTSGGSGSSSTTRPTRSVSSSSTSTKPRTVDRPEYYSPLLWRDSAMALLYAFADAAPLSPAGREGGTRAGQDAARGVRLAGHAHLVRPVAPPRLGGCRLPRGPVARRRRQGTRRVLEVVSRRTLRRRLIYPAGTFRLGRRRASAARSTSSAML